MKKLYDRTIATKAGYENIIGDKSSGFINTTQCKYEWALKIYQRMLDLTWFPQEVSTVGEAKRYTELTESEKRMYDLAFAQLSFDDSVQGDAIQMLNTLITNRIVCSIGSDATFLRRFSNDVPFVRIYSGFRLLSATSISILSLVGGEIRRGFVVKAKRVNLSCIFFVRISLIVFFAASNRVG